MSEQLLGFPAQEVAADFEGRCACALDDGDAGAAARKLQGECRAGKTATNRNGIEVRHAAITARGRAARNIRVEARRLGCGSALVLLNEAVERNQQQLECQEIENEPGRVQQHPPIPELRDVDERVGIPAGEGACTSVHTR